MIKWDTRKRDNPRSIHLGFRTDLKTYEKLKKEAEEKGITMSFHIHQLLISLIS